MAELSGIGDGVLAEILLGILIQPLLEVYTGQPIAFIA